MQRDSQFQDCLRYLKSPQFKPLLVYFQQRREQVIRDLAALEDPGGLHRAQGRYYELDNFISLLSEEATDR